MLTTLSDLLYVACVGLLLLVVVLQFFPISVALGMTLFLASAACAILGGVLRLLHNLASSTLQAKPS